MSPNAAATRPSPAPASYTPKHLAERILTSKTALEGERKQVTVLFADLKGSMELLADRDPEEARKLLDPVLRHMMEAVHRFEGTVNQVMGDGIMALFGAPIAHEDHAVRACYAALRMQDAVKRYADTRHAHGVKVQIRVGLHSGEVVVRAIDNDLHMDYSAVGQTTHLAARMEQMAVPGAIFMTASTHELVEPYVRVSAHGLKEIKGVAERIAVFELTGASGLRTRFQTSLSRGLSPFVGRETALMELRSALRCAAEGRGQVVAMPGEPGIGKSRLLYEFVQSMETRDWLILEGRAFSYTQKTPYLPLVDLLKGYFQIQDRDDATKIGHKIADKLAVDEAAATLVAPICALLDLPADDQAWAVLDPRERRQRTLDACRHILVRESRVQPVVIILEDLHWVDTETQAFLDALIESVASARILLLLNYRPEYRHGWGSKTYYRQVRLQSLTEMDAGALLAALLGSDPGLAPMQTMLFQQTEGNPFFLEECVRSLIESNVVTREHDTYRLSTDVSRLRLPATVHAILAARIDRLAPEDKALLQAAAVIGKEVPWSLLSAIAGGGDSDMRAGLSRLQNADLIVEGQLFPDLKYTFRHALTHEVAYENLLHEQRRALHAQVVDAIETRYRHRLTEHVEALGYHALRSERWEKATAYFRQAGEKARARSAHRQAIDHVRRALEALRHLPATLERQRTAVDLRLELRSSLYITGDVARSIENLNEAEQIATAIEDSGRLGWVLVFIGEDARLVGDLARARACFDRARALGSVTGDELLVGLAMGYSGIVLHALGDYKASIENFRASTDAQGRVESTARQWAQTAAGSADAGRVVNQTWLARSLAVIGEFEEAIVLAKDALATAERIESPYAILQAAMSLGEAYRQRGDWAHAIASLDRSQRITAERDFRLMTSWVETRLGIACVAAGQVARGLQLLRSAASNVDAGKKDVRYSLVIRLLGEGCSLTGAIAEARACATEALAVAKTLGLRGDEAAAQCLLAQVSDAAELVEDSQLGFATALELASLLRMRPLVAHCQFGLGSLYHRTGRRHRAEEHLTTAATMYRAMGMTYWLEQTEAEATGLA